MSCCVINTERHQLRCQSVSRVVEQLRWSDMWTKAARWMTSLDIGTKLIQCTQACVAPLVMFLLDIGDLRLHQFGLASSVQALWVDGKL